MKNLKVGDVVEKKCHFMEHQIEWGGDCYCCEKCGTVLKENTLIATTVTAVLDEIEMEVESRIKEWEASEDNDRTLNDGLYSLRQFIKAKRTEI